MERSFLILMITMGLNALFSPTSSAAIPDKAKTLSFNVQLLNADAGQKKKIDDAIELIKEVIASEDFKNRVLKHSYEGKKGFVDSKGLSNLQTYNMLLDGAEDLKPVKNNAMDLEIEFYSNTWTSTVGYTRPNTTKIWMNTKYFDTYQAKNVARNLIHEWLHKLGFTHEVSYSKRRDYSVPYAVGYLVEELAGKL